MAGQSLNNLVAAAAPRGARRPVYRQIPSTAVGWPGRPAWAQIDLNAIADNVQSLIGAVAPAKVMAVVKANAYGHGAVAIASAALQAGASTLAVACVDEGIELRNAGIGAPILVMGHTPAYEALRVAEHHLTVTLDTVDLARALAQIAQHRQTTQSVHLKIDTGMSRFGLLPAEVLPFAQLLQTMPSIKIEGIFTHLARADEPDPTPTHSQAALFTQILLILRERRLPCGMVHAANTAAALDHPSLRLDAVRCGIGLTGIYPSSTVSHDVSLRPALRLVSRLVRVRQLPRGTSIGYGGTHILQSDSSVGLVPLGYADGLPRLLSNRGSVLIDGVRCPIVGNISMDQTTVLLPQDRPIQEGDEVVLLGEQGEQLISVEEWAHLAHTIPYEILTGLSARVPRLYERSGSPVMVQTLLGATSL